MRYLLLLLVIFMGLSPNYAQLRFRHTELELRNDNDMYLMNMQDQYYTNGLFLNLRKLSILPN